MDNGLHQISPRELFEMFLQILRNVNIPDKDYNTPLHTNQSADNCKMLIELGACVDNVNKHRETPLHLVENAEKCELLIQNGADINAMDESGRTPLFKACEDNRIEVIYTLLSYGADAKMQDIRGRTPLCKIGADDPVLVQILVELTFDESQKSIHWLDLVRASRWYPVWVFQKLVEHISKIQIGSNIAYEYYRFISLLIRFKPYYLQMVLAKFKETVVEAVDFFVHNGNSFLEDIDDNLLIPHELDRFTGTLRILQEHGFLAKIVVHLLCNNLEEYCHHYVNCDHHDLDQVTAVLLILVNNGLILSQKILNDIYIRHNDCELFRILIHCQLSTTSYYPELALMPRLIYDISLSIEMCLQAPRRYIREHSVMDLLDHFALNQLQQYCRTRFEKNEKIQNKLKMMPKIPKLLELTRNSVRLVMIKAIDKKTASQLHINVESQIIPLVCKDLLVFKRKLYVPN